MILTFFLIPGLCKVRPNNHPIYHRILMPFTGNNQLLGSPVNRIRLTGEWASRSLAIDPKLTVTERLREDVGYLLFRVVMASIDIIFYYTRLRQWVSLLFGRNTRSFEDELERTMRGFAKDNFGVEITEAAFEG